jgi:hypothetical protein
MIPAGSARTLNGALLLCGASLLLAANSDSTPAGYSGAPVDQTCAACHGRPQPPNNGSGRLSLSLVNATGYTPGRPLRLRITLEDPFGARWGFQLTARRGSGSDVAAGGFAPIQGQGTAVAPSEANPAYINQSASGTRPNIPNRVSWEVDWNAPPELSGTVSFFAAAVAGNNTNGADSGDFVYTSQLVVAQGGEAVSASRVLPQFVFGSGFISTLSFSNTKDLAAIVRVNFFGADGSPMPVNGDASRMITLPPKATASIRADDTGPLTQGWALIDMPDGVTGNAVFRQRVSGRIDQEAVVMLSRTDSKLERFIYDQSPGTNTALVLLNTSTIDALVTIRIRAESGALAATLNRTLAPRTRTTIDFRSEPSLASVQGRRGLAEFEVGGASIAVLALRFDDTGALTSVPNAEK